MQNFPGLPTGATLVLFASLTFQIRRLLVLIRRSQCCTPEPFLIPYIEFFISVTQIRFVLGNYECFRLFCHNAYQDDHLF